MTDGPSRRRYLFALGSTIPLAGCPNHSSTSTIQEQPFDTVVNAVADLGFDKTGRDPIDEAFSMAYETGTLIEFPPGTYRITTEQQKSDVSRFGIRGIGESRRDVQIRPDPGTTVKWLKAVDVGPHLIENVSFDERNDRSTQLSLWLTTSDGSIIRNVEWLGRTPDDSGVRYSLTAEVTEQKGQFLIDGIYAGLDKPAVPVNYPNGVAFLRSGSAHKGEVILRNPVIHRRNSNATRATSTTGVYTIKGGEFANNQNSNIRFGAGLHPTKKSSAQGSKIIVDGSRDTADAVRVDGKEQTGAIFRDLDILWTKSGGRGVISAPEWGGHGRAEFYNCVIHNDGKETLTINAEPTSVKNAAMVFENCSFTGLGGGLLAMDRPGSVLRDSCINMPNASISGFKTSNLSTSSCRLPEGLDVTDRADETRY